ncbi:MAG: hypothetical protein LC785_15615, partial [Acidobacteria bacterium]|nr:hypothetical protein [Acidobacteriota bacterium]MCA1643334.1 hypothetical protein [Acidobacteriota bacterium]
MTFGIGVFVSLVVSGLISPPKANSRAVAILVPAREWHPIYPHEKPFTSSDFLIVQQSVKSPSITEPISEFQPEYDLIEHTCG